MVAFNWNSVQGTATRLKNTSKAFGKSSVGFSVRKRMLPKTRCRILIDLWVFPLRTQIMHG